MASLAVKGLTDLHNHVTIRVCLHVNLKVQIVEMSCLVKMSHLMEIAQRKFYTTHIMEILFQWQLVFYM